jgi:acyl-coenzyme A thioesterase 13
MSTESNPRVDAYRSQIGREIQFNYPILKYLGYKVLEVEEGFIQVEMVARKELLNPVGLLHGGVIAMLMDELIGAAGWTLNRPHPFVTINLNIDFLSGARELDVLVAEAIIVRPGKNVLHGEARVYHTSGKLLAKSTSNVIKAG